MDHRGFLWVMEYPPRRKTAVPDIDPYQQNFGLRNQPRVTNVELSTEQQEILVQVEHPPGTQFSCPECDRELGCYDHVPSRRGRHLDSCHFETMLS